MDGKVRIAPDGRGEVGVICQRKAEVALGLRLVLCLGHAAQHTCVHRALQIGAPGIGQQLRKLQRGGRIARKMEVHTRRRQRLLQLFDPLWVRRFVHTVHERQLQPPRQRRGIGQQHKFLDHLLRLAAFALHHVHTAARLVQHQLCLAALNIHRAPGCAQLGQLVVQLAHQRQLLRHGGVTLAQRVVRRAFTSLYTPFTRERMTDFTNA